MATRPPTNLCTSTWQLVAERGLYAFDGDHNGGPYELVAVPAGPCVLEALPPAVHGVVSLVAFRVDFANAQTLSEAVLRAA